MNRSQAVTARFGSTVGEAQVVGQFGSEQDAEQHLKKRGVAWSEKTTSGNRVVFTGPGEKAVAMWDRTSNALMLMEAKDNGDDADAKDIIKELIETGWSGDNDKQGKAVQLLRGLAFSDDPAANKFMKALDKHTSGLNVNDFTK